MSSLTALGAEEASAEPRAALMKRGALAHLSRASQAPLWHWVRVGNKGERNRQMERKFRERGRERREKRKSKHEGAESLASAGIYP